MTAFTASLSDTVGITDSLGRQSVLHRAFSDTVGITEVLRAIHNTDTVGITATLDVSSSRYVQFDTWRPVARPDNKLILLCRTPEGEHDSYLGLTNLSLWTVFPDTTNENPVVLPPNVNGFGWTSYGHPEWAPDGNTVVVWVETATSYKLVLIDSSEFLRQ